MAAPEPYLPLIAQICKALSQRERRAVVYLCDSADTDDSPARLREILESKVKSCERGDLFLAELLLHIKRIDVLKSIFGCETVETVTNRQTLSKFRVLMVNVSEDLTMEDLNTLRFLLGSVLPRERLDRAKCFLDMVTELEKQDQVSAERVDFIDKCLRDIGRVDLARRVNVNAAAACEQHTPQLQRCNPPWPHPVRQFTSCPLQTRPVLFSLVAAEHIPKPLHRERLCPVALDHYKLNTNPRGVCVIIDCVGNDGEMLAQTFRTLHFSVFLHKWLNIADTLSTLRGLCRNGRLCEADVFVCCIVSRGTDHHLLATDANYTGLHIDSLRRLFTADDCPALAGKPKLFFIQRYSVPEYQPVAQRNYSEEELETDGVLGHLVPTDADVFWSHCWTDERQLQEKEHSSIYLRALTEALQRGQRRNAHLVDVHIEVNAAIYDHNKKNPAEPYHIDLKHTLRKNLYLQ